MAWQGGPVEQKVKGRYHTYTVVSVSYSRGPAVVRSALLVMRFTSGATLPAATPCCPLNQASVHPCLDHPLGSSASSLCAAAAAEERVDLLSTKLGEKWRSLAHDDRSVKVLETSSVNSTLTPFLYPFRTASILCRQQAR